MCPSLKSILVFCCTVYLLPLPLPNNLKHQEFECVFLEILEHGVYRVLARTTSAESEGFLKTIDSPCIKFHNSRLVGTHSLDSHIQDESSHDSNCTDNEM